MVPLVFADELKFTQQETSKDEPLNSLDEHSGIDSDGIMSDANSHISNYWKVNFNGAMIALKSVHNRYVVAEDWGGANANRVVLNLWEEFRFEYLGNLKIALKSAHNKYLVAEQNGEVNANRAVRDTWETFTIELIEDGFPPKVALKSFHNKYLVAESDGRLNANRDHRGPWEIFTLQYIPPDSVIQHCINLEGKTIALKSSSIKDGRYVVAESNGEANANRDWRGAWEEFKVEYLGNSKIALKSVHNKYLVAELNGDVNANRDRKDIWETFTIEFNKFYKNTGEVALKSFHNKYLFAFRGQLYCNGLWAQFKLEVVR